MQKHGWLVVLGGVCAVGPLSIDMYLPGAPAMARELGAGGWGVQLSVVSHLLGLVVGQLVYGPLSDHIGRKPPLYIGFTLYILASVGCALANSISLFIFLRFFQGIGGCVGMVIARAVVRDRTDTIGAAHAFSILMLVVSAAPLLAPLFGATLLQQWGWRAMFGAMSLFGAFCILAIRISMSETHKPDRAFRFSWRGMLSGYLSLLQNRTFVSYTLCNGLVQGSMYAYIAGSSFVLIDLYGIAPRQYSLLFALNSLGMIVASQINARLIERVELDHIMKRALGFSAAVGFAAALMMVSNPAIVVLLVGFFLLMVSIGFVAPNAAAIALTGHAEYAGAASALMGTLLFAIGALCGIAVALLHDGTARPLVLVMAMCTIGAALAHRFAVR